ncbi:MAG: hypothetical protein V7L04_05565 [Nostoc sp.]
MTLPTQAFAVKLYGAGSLRDSLTQVGESFNEKYGIPVNTVRIRFFDDTPLIAKTAIYRISCLNRTVLGFQ